MFNLIAADSPPPPYRVHSSVSPHGGENMTPSSQHNSLESPLVPPSRYPTLSKLPSKYPGNGKRLHITSVYHSQY